MQPNQANNIRRSLNHSLGGQYHDPRLTPDVALRIRPREDPYCHIPKAHPRS